ncbi:hypothetical protein D3C71_1311550 [compost metagenome]
MHLGLGLRVPAAGLVLQLLGGGLDLGLLLLVAGDLHLPTLATAVVGGGVACELRQRLLGALRLEVIPLVRSLGLLDGRVVLVEAGVGLRGPAHVREDRARRRNGRGAHGDLSCRAHALA